MIKTYLLAWSLLLLLNFHGFTQNGPVWNNKKCAVALTYDDALNVHLDNAIPVLDSLGLKATFYLTAAFQGSTNRLSDWRSVAKNGHELGNHTLFHPCTGNTPGREWVKPDYALEKYTHQRMLDELRMTNTFLEAIDGNKKRTFAYPCGDMRIGDSSYVDAIKKDFFAARGVTGKLVGINEVDLYDVSCFVINGESGDELIALVKKAMESNTLLVFLFHGVGGEHGLNVSLQAHRQLLKFLSKNEKEIWVAPLIDITTHVAEYQSQKK